MILKRSGTSIPKDLVSRNGLDSFRLLHLGFGSPHKFDLGPLCSKVQVWFILVVVHGPQLSNSFTALLMELR
jgi:hypothetical protein